MSDRRRRGRPTVSHDNSRVRDFLLHFDALSDLCEVHPSMQDIFAGLGAAVSDGDTSKRGLLRSRIYGLIAGCSDLSTQAVSEALAYAAYSAATIKRYALAARCASVLVARELDRALLD